MADAKKCDRCGKYYTPSVSVKNPLEVLAESLSRTYSFSVEMKKAIGTVCDLCPDCMKSFERWFDTEEGDADGKERTE